jgi:hypothetical protein
VQAELPHVLATLEGDNPMGSKNNLDRSLTDLIATLLGTLLPRMKLRTVKLLQVSGGLSGLVLLYRCLEACTTGHSCF